MWCGRHMRTLLTSVGSFKLSLDPMQTIQRADLWRVILALPGLDYLTVVRHIGRLLDGIDASGPVDLENDGDR